MMQELRFRVQNIAEFKSKIYQWLQGHEHAVCLDSNDYPHDPYRKFDLIAAFGSETLSLKAGDAFEQLQKKLEDEPSWWFGILGYDLKNELEDLSSPNAGLTHWPDLDFFKADVVVKMIGDIVEIHSLTDPEKIKEEILLIQPPQLTANRLQGELQSRMSYAAYNQAFDRVIDHLLMGDIYEMNLCQEFYSESKLDDPLSTFQRINKVTAAPFAGYLRSGSRHLLSFSPERFLQKTESKLISQPIKGTISRGKDAEEDEEFKQQLQQDPKERSENVMIVDLVRNDLSRSCVPGSVKVPELFGIYSFKNVHQMISTVEGELRNDVEYIEAIKNAFPMGSMTGAPKISAMNIISDVEQIKRGWYSGALGYFTPDGDFDFNVVIRSICYDEELPYLSIQAGGAITALSNCAQEYAECRLKVANLGELLLDMRY